jgi:2-polyprenyl-3-methyl-5-hydroxy-6-metoxy-1,4-benzoquinol methylase/glycosyltransferase involved in cell wall biosynthesis
MPFNGDTIPSGQSLGGSESAAYYVAKELVKLGHHVTVFTNHQHRTESGDIVGQWWDGVLYEWLGNPSDQFPLGDRFHAVMQAPFDVVIVQRHPGAFIRPFNSKLNLWWLHDLALYNTAGLVQPHLLNIDKVLCVSEWHKRQVSKVYDIPLEHIIATKNGVDYSAFPDQDDTVREPRSLFYMARPERGLEYLVGPGGIMEDLKDCHLYVCGYNNTQPNMAGFYNYLWQRCEELPNVTNLGHLGKADLYKAMSKAMIYVYPTIFEDTSCIAALEANAAGLPVIGSDWSAVPETLTGAGAILLPLKDGQVDKQEFIKTVRRVFAQPTLYDSLQKKALAKRQTWEEIARQWDQAFTDLLKEKSSNPDRLARHLEHMSDIVPAREAGLTGRIPDYEVNYSFFENGTYADHYKRYYEYEANRGVVYGPESLTGNPRFETVLGMIARANPKTILDYGCAHGHYVMNIMTRIQPGTIKVTGIDIDKSNIEKAEAWAREVGCQDFTKFLCGSLEDLKARPDMMFDVVICSEVLEHVPNPQEYIDELHKHLNPGGTFIGTTPYGPWEAIGYKEHQGWRAHLWHFERQDLNEMLGHMDAWKMVAVPWQGEYGHYVFSFTKTDDAPSRQIDYTRKLNTQAPRETVSVCMIAYNEEGKIRATLEKIKDIADEIIVGIDNKTTDRTAEICHAFGASTFLIESPLVQGFDEARNRTIEQASMDWIMWIDADETFENLHNLPKYLRSNCFNGYAIKQLHFAAEPEGLIQTDLPVRLFRNRKGIRFFGVVHEHPEIVMNDGLGKVTVINDVAIMHTGYATEAIRRKRFERNWPLMVRDREKYPKRVLGKFLWMRDLSHYNRYLFERSGQILPQMIENARIIVSVWEELIESDHIRMVVDALPYYTEAVNMITQGRGIQYTVDMSASKNNGGARLPAHPVAAMFPSRREIEKLTSMLIKHNTQNYEDRYFV